MCFAINISELETSTSTSILHTNNNSEVQKTNKHKVKGTVHFLTGDSNINMEIPCLTTFHSSLV